MIADQLLDGHILLADWFFLIAAAVFLVAAVVVYIRQPGNDAKRDIVPSMVPFGLCLTAVAWLVL